MSVCSSVISNFLIPNFQTDLVLKLQRNDFMNWFYNLCITQKVCLDFFCLPHLKSVQRSLTWVRDRRLWSTRWFPQQLRAKKRFIHITLKSDMFRSTKVNLGPQISPSKGQKVRLINLINVIVEAYCFGGRYDSVVRFLVLTKTGFLLIAKVLKETIYRGLFLPFLLDSCFELISSPFSKAFKI